MAEKYSPILDASGHQSFPSAESRAVRNLRARLDAAQTTAENRRHWANADHLAADAAYNPQVRRTIRSRARMEAYENNSFANGLVRTKGAYVFGWGPSIQFKSRNSTFNTFLEKSFVRWARKVRLSRKLRQMGQAKTVDGETFGVLVHNPRLDHEVKLDVAVRESDECTTPELAGNEKNRVDGIDLDDLGNPLRYSFLKHHPGGLYVGGNPLENEWIDARYVLHWFNGDRPGQHRGVSELAPALSIFAMIRRFALATLAAAETSADFAAVMYTDSPAMGDIDQDVEPMDSIELEMRSMLTLPKGWKLGQIKQEHPATTFEMFRNAMWNEAARAILAPFNIAAGNSQQYNYASGRLDHQAWDLVIDIERDDCEQIILDQIVEWWLRWFLSLKSGIAPSDIDVSNYSWGWYWPPREHVDQEKNARAKQILWEMGIIADEDIWLEEGLHPTDQEAKLDRQKARRERLGLPSPGAKNFAPAGQAPKGDEKAREAGEDTEEEVEAFANIGPY